MPELPPLAGQKVSGWSAYLMSGAGFFTPVASPAGVLIKQPSEVWLCY
ncbi:MAG: hypothetical protein WAV05_13240 [Anaerolineales bacterium]